MAVTKILLLAMILDFSGSMDQMIDNQRKADVLKTHVSGALSALPPEQKLWVSIFGAHPKRGCDDLESRTENPSQLMDFVRRQQPGPYGKTPLAKALRSVEPLVRQDRLSRLLVITDGADTCGENPCAALKELDVLLGKRGKKIEVFVVGFDLRQEGEGLACMKNLKLDNISLKFLIASDSDELAKMLKNSLEQGKWSDSSEDATKKEPFNAKGQGNAGSAKKQEQPDLSGKVSPGPSAIEIQGAPAYAQFALYQKGQKIREWKGAFALETPVGDYEVEFLDPNGKRIPVKVPEGKVSIPFVDLLRKPTGDISIEHAFFNLKFTPSEEVKAIAPKAEAITTQGFSDEKHTVKTELILGSWSFGVMSPPWLVGRFKDRSLKSDPLRPQTLDLKALYGSEIRWIPNKKPQEPRVLRIVIESEKRDESHFIPPGMPAVPVYYKDKFQWLD